MKVLILGADHSATEQVQLAIRFGWPDAEFHQAATDGEAIAFVDFAGADLVVAVIPRDDVASSEFCSTLREFSDVALIVVDSSGWGSDLEEVRVLRAGADEYIRSSTALPAVVARVAAVMRRVHGRSDSPSSEMLFIGDLTLKPGTFEAFVNQRKVELTATEFNLLHVLARHKNVLVRHEVIGRALWGDAVDSGKLLKKYVHRVRQKLADATDGEHEYIRSVYSVGYLLVDSPLRKRSESVDAA